MDRGGLGHPLRRLCNWLAWINTFWGEKGAGLGNVWLGEQGTGFCSSGHHVHVALGWGKRLLRACDCRRGGHARKKVRVGCA